MHTYTHACMNTCTPACTHWRACTCTYTCMHAHMYTCMHTLTCMHMHTHMHACTHVHVHTHTHRHTNCVSMGLAVDLQWLHTMMQMQALTLISCVQLTFWTLAYHLTICLLKCAIFQQPIMAESYFTFLNTPPGANKPFCSIRIYITYTDKVFFQVLVIIIKSSRLKVKENIVQ